MRRGFSLIELVFVICIAAIIAAIGLTRNSSSDARHRLDLAERRVEADMRLARRDAWHASTPRRFIFDAATDSYTIEGMVDDAGNPYVVELGKAPYFLDLQSVDIAGLSEVTFDGRESGPPSGTMQLKAGGITEARVITGE